jgi:hypothetical protein
VLAVGTAPAIAHAGEPLMAEIAVERSRLMDSYQAGLHGYSGERELWAALAVPAPLCVSGA